MEELKLKLEKEAECVKFDKRTGFPLKVIINHVLQKAGADKEYYENVVKDSFAGALVYIAEYLLKEIVESEECYVPDEVVYTALDRWFVEKDKRLDFISVLKDVKHPQCKNRNPFFESNFLSKDNLEKMDKSMKDLLIMMMFINKYYVEPKPYTPSKPTKKYTPPITKKPKEPTLFDMLDENKEEKVEESKETAAEEKTVDTAEDVKAEEVLTVKESETESVKEDVVVPMGETSPSANFTEDIPKPTEEEIEAALKDMTSAEAEEIPSEEPSTETVSVEIKEETIVGEENPVKEVVQIPRSAAQKSSKSKKQQLEGQFDLFSMF